MSDTETRVKYEFTEVEYVGDACKQLIDYLRRCWTVYQSLRIVPCGLVVQSYGFGKSRLLYQLAHETKMRDELGMRVLYLCTRMYPLSGYPEATNNLTSWLFQSDCYEMSHHLEVLYRYAYDNWSTVGDEWIEVFTNCAADGAVMKKLCWPEAKYSDWSFIQAKSAEQLIGDESSGPGKVVILAVDCASAVLTVEYGTDYTRDFRQALVRANKRIQKYHPSGGIFAVLADQKTNVAGINSSTSSDKSMMLSRFLETLSFPTFILTGTMDVFWRNYVAELGLDEIAAYKFVVTHTRVCGYKISAFDGASSVDKYTQWLYEEDKLRRLQPLFGG